MIAHKLKICTFYFVHISFSGLLILDLFSVKCLEGVKFCVIYNSNSFHSFTFIYKSIKQVFS